MKRPRGTILLVDDEAYVRHSLAAVLEQRGFEVRTAGGLEQALGQHDLEGLDALVTDLRMAGGDGLQLITRVHALDESLPIVVYTGHGSVASAVDCMRAGASDYLQKPVDPDQMVLVLERAIELSDQRRQLRYLRERPHAAGAAGPIGVSPAWRRAVDQALRVAASDTAVLLLGETGSGKGELAALIHRSSPRSAAAYVEVACAAVPLELFEAEFFGHRKGAFTGAVEDREGRFRVAHRGTLFLDDVEALPLAAQAKVLRVLETGRFERVGDSRPTSVDVRLISASNRDLKAEVEAGRFREDLWYRINVMTLRLPPLRERPEDIPVLAEAFRERFARRLGRPVRAIDGEALERLRGYSWPGNVRE
ncbi:MAG: sigma-54-dependent transcriptional regulator, partial [Thermoanaerobaculia bacterium]